MNLHWDIDWHKIIVFRFRDYQAVSTKTSIMYVYIFVWIWRPILHVYRFLTPLLVARRLGLISTVMMDTFHNYLNCSMHSSETSLELAKPHVDVYFCDPESCQIRLHGFDHRKTLMDKYPCLNAHVYVHINLKCLGNVSIMWYSCRKRSWCMSTWIQQWSKQCTRIVLHYRIGNL